MPLLCLSSDIVANTCTDLSCRINHFTGLFLFWQSRSLNQDELCKICFLWCCCKMHGTYLQYFCIDLSLMYAWNIDLLSVWLSLHERGDDQSTSRVECLLCKVHSPTVMKNTDKVWLLHGNCFKEFSNWYRSVSLFYRGCIVLECDIKVMSLTLTGGV